MDVLMIMEYSKNIENTEKTIDWLDKNRLLNDPSLGKRGINEKTIS